MLIAAFKFCDRAVHLVGQGASALHQGLWLGLLSDADLDRLTEDYYDGVARYVDSDFISSGLKRWEERLIPPHFAPGSRVLVAAAGGGREVIALRRAGYVVDGFDCNRSYVEAGNRLLHEKRLDARLLWAPPGRVPATLGVYDGAIIGWAGYMHMRGRRTRLGFLGELGAHLAPGSPLLLSVFHCNQRGRAQIWSARIANIVRKPLGRDAIEPGDHLSGSFDHYFTTDELSSELAAAGFNVIHFEKVEEGYAAAVGRSRSDVSAKAPSP